MNIDKKINGSSMTIDLSGRLDTTTAPSFEKVINEDLNGITDLTLEFGHLDYVSSAGLRIILLAQKKMNRQGKMVIKNVKQDIKEVFEITGFLDILNLE